MNFYIKNTNKKYTSTKNTNKHKSQYTRASKTLQKQKTRKDQSVYRYHCKCNKRALKCIKRTRSLTLTYAYSCGKVFMLQDIFTLQKHFFFTNSSPFQTRCCTVKMNPSRDKHKTRKQKTTDCCSVKLQLTFATLTLSMNVSFDPAVCLRYWYSS